MKNKNRTNKVIDPVHNFLNLFASIFNWIINQNCSAKIVIFEYFTKENVFSKKFPFSVSLYFVLKILAQIWSMLPSTFNSASQKYKLRVLVYVFKYTGLEDNRKANPEMIARADRPAIILQ